MWSSPKSLHRSFEDLYVCQSPYLNHYCCCGAAAGEGWEVIMKGKCPGRTHTYMQSEGREETERKEEREGRKEGRMDGWRTNQWGAALKKTSERAKQSKAKQYTSEEIMRVTLSCGCDELSVVCRSETSRNDETVCVCVCQCMCVCLKSS